MTTKEIKHIAEGFSWKFTHPQPDPWYMRFERDGSLIDVWPTTMTVRVIKNNKPDHHHECDEGTLQDLFDRT